MLVPSMRAFGMYAAQEQVLWNAVCYVLASNHRILNALDTSRAYASMHNGTLLYAIGHEHIHATNQ
jgi:hypothetical protein